MNTVDLIQTERERAVRCVEAHYELVDDDKLTLGLLHRITNLIRSGENAVGLWDDVEDEGCVEI